MSAPAIQVRPHHFSVSVPDIGRAIRFWCNVFGARLQHEFAIAPLDARGAFLALPGIRLELWELRGTAPQPAARSAPNTDLGFAGIKHMAFLVDDVAAALDAAAAHGVTIAATQSAATAPMTAGPPPPGAPVFAAFILDPFGHLIELLSPQADMASQGDAD